MKILLVRPFCVTVYGLPENPPLGIGMLGTILRDLGHDVKLVDMRLPSHSRAYLFSTFKAFAPDVVGFSASSFEWNTTTKLAREIKDIRKKTCIVAGGYHVSLCPDRALEREEIDFICVGEGERSFVKFLVAYPDVDAIREIGGIGYRDEGGGVQVNLDYEFISDLDQLPFIDFGLFPIDEYSEKGEFNIPVFTSRGCPYNCIFCSSFKTQGKKYRAFTPKRLVDELEYNARRFNTRSFNVLDDNFNFDKGRVIAICDEIKRRKLDVSWMCAQGIRADRADEEMFHHMKEAGCRLVSIGIESVDEEVLRHMNKGETLAQIKAAIFAAHKSGLMVKGFFIVGSPYDNVKKVMKSIEFFKAHSIEAPRFSMIVAYPNTRLDEWVRANASSYRDPYEYVTRHTELYGADVQFETMDFTAKERLRIFKFADREADIWLIFNMLKTKLGLLPARFILPIFYVGLVRCLLKAMYKKRWVGI